MLTEQLTADAAALHQAILDHGGEVSPFFCGKELGWEQEKELKYFQSTFSWRPSS